MPKKKGKGKKKKKKKGKKGKKKSAQVKIMSLGDIEKRLLQSCAKAINICEKLLLNLHNHKETLRVEDNKLNDLRKLFMDALTHKFLADKDIMEVKILQNALGRYLNIETFLSRAEATCMTCPLEVAPKLFYVPLREAFSVVYDILDQRATLCNRRLLGLSKFTELWNVIFKEFTILQEIAKLVFSKFLSYRVLAQKYCGAGKARANHEMRMQKNWASGRGRGALFPGKLTKAAKQGDFKKCMTLLQKGCNPNEMEERSGAAPLHHVCWDGNVPIAELLLRRGALVNVQTMRGFTPLHFAYENHHYELISVLIQSGADVNIKSSLGTVPSEMKNARKHMRQIQQRIKAHEKEVRGEMMEMWEEPVATTRQHDDIMDEAVHKFKMLVKPSGGPGGDASDHLPDIATDAATEKPATPKPPTPTFNNGKQQLPQTLGGAQSNPEKAPAIRRRRSLSRPAPPEQLLQTDATAPAKKVNAWPENAQQNN